MKTLKIIITIILTSFIFITLAVRLFGVRYSVVQTSSMHPTIPKMSLVYIKDLDESEVLSTIKVNDIIVVDVGGSMPRMHRIIEIDGNLVTTKGDHNDSADAPVTSDKVIGIVIFSIPIIGVFFNTIYPWLILVSIIVVYYGLKYILKELKKR